MLLQIFTGTRPVNPVRVIAWDQVAEKAISYAYIFLSALQMNPHLRLFIVADLPLVGAIAMVSPTFQEHVLAL